MFVGYSLHLKSRLDELCICGVSTVNVMLLMGFYITVLLSLISWSCVWHVPIPYFYCPDDKRLSLGQQEYCWV